MDIRPLVIILAMGIPLLILDWFLIRIAKVYIKRIRQSKLNDGSTKNEYIQLILLLFIVIIISFLIIFLLGMGLAPNILSGIPIVIKMLIMTFIIVIYGCFAAFLYGLKDVIRAGGSAAEVMKTLSNYIYEYLNNDRPKESGKKDYNESKKR